jgi:hypothetical protein
MKNIGRGVVWAVACASLMTVSAVPAADAQPAFQVESSQLEVGPVASGTVAVATFVFHNNSDAEVHILRAAPS